MFKHIKAILTEYEETKFNLKIDRGQLIFGRELTDFLAQTQLTVKEKIEIILNSLKTKMERFKMHHIKEMSRSSSSTIHFRQLFWKQMKFFKARRFRFLFYKKN